MYTLKDVQEIYPDARVKLPAFRAVCNTYPDHGPSVTIRAKQDGDYNVTKSCECACDIDLSNVDLNKLVELTAESYGSRS